MMATAIKLLVPYLLLVTGLIVLLQSGRRWALDELATPAAQQQWDNWREDVELRRDPQAESVQRRTPKSLEPPGLVLMRDYFGICLAAAVGFTSLLYAVIVWLILGVRSVPAQAGSRPTGIAGDFLEE